MEYNTDKTELTGALRDFISLFENPRQAKQADAWKRFFLSESFLGEQFSEEFARQMFFYLTGPGQKVCTPKELPAGFLQELAIAYAVSPDLHGEEQPGALLGREYAAKIFDISPEEWGLKRKAFGRLSQPGVKVRYNAFSDYRVIREMGARGELTEENREAWEKILKMCQVHYLYERNGKQMGWGDYESRSECVVKLYVQWLKDEKIPQCVLTYLYKKLDFRNLDRSSTRGLYGGVKEQVIRQLPDVEEILFGDGGKEQAITKLYRDIARIINDHQTNYDHHIYGETEEIRQRITELFAQPQWQELKGDLTFFDRLFFVAKRLVMPPSMAGELLGYLEDGGFPEPKRKELSQSVLRTLGIERLCREINYRYDMVFSHTSPEDIGSSEDFWQYFLMRGFGWRHRKVRGEWEEDYIYVKDSECYLPGYMDYLFSPSRAWQMEFLGWDEEKESIAAPVSAGCAMPGGGELRVEFHYHYCLYFVNGEQVLQPVLTFSDLKDHGEKIQDPIEFFFLLAVTSIKEEERQEAASLIGKWLEKIPLHPLARPVIAGLLAADNDPLPLDAKAVYYGEQERFCFRAVVRDKGTEIFRQAEYGWRDIIFRQPEFGWHKTVLPWELKRKADEEGNAGKILDCLRQPRPVCCGRRTVAGMDRAEKMAAILEVMGYEGKEESYCVLRYGDKKKRRHDRVFYGVKVPFGFPIRAQSEDHERWISYIMSVSAAKIKERKWLVARFGWGFKYSNQSDFRPVCVYQGESGSFYGYGLIKMHRADSVAGVLADLLAEEFEGVTEAKVYEGCLTVSRFDHRLEYCYGREEEVRSFGTEEETAADWFTVFGRYEMWREFARWMDGLLGEELPEWVDTAVISLDMDQGGALCFRGIHMKRYGELPWEDEDTWIQEEGDVKSELQPWGYEEEETLDYQEYCPEAPLFIWRKGLDEAGRKEELKEAVEWYARTGLQDQRIEIVVW